MISALSPNIKLLNKDENEIFKNFQRNYNFSRNSALFGLQLHSRIMNCQYQANPKSESPVLSKPNWFSLFLFLWNVFDNNGKLIFWARVPILVFIPSKYRLKDVCSGFSPQNIPTSCFSSPYLWRQEPEFLIEPTTTNNQITFTLEWLADALNHYKLLL